MNATSQRGILKLHIPQLALAVMCLWMSGIAQLHHTDDLSAFQTFLGSHNQQFSSATQSAPDMCAACEWDQLQSAPQTPVVDVDYLPLIRLSAALETPSTALVGCFDHYSLRGPPAQIS